MSLDDSVVERLKAALADRYQIQRQIGEGGMAVVFLAQDLKHDRPVAVKVLRPELSAFIGAERFLREIQISAKLNHPHILTLIDSGDAAGLLYYVMPYVEGESLREKMEREGQLPLDEAFKIVREVADGLGYAHRLDIIHRDIKPENVLLSEGHAIVTDFGIAKAVTLAGGRITKTGGSVGSPLYMSPEQAAGQGKLDGRSDLYSLACMLFEMLAGEPPFTGQNLQAIISKHAMEAPPTVRVLRASVPEAVETALRKALAKSPADRFRTVAEFAEILSGVASAGDGEGPPRGEGDPRRESGFGRTSGPVHWRTLWQPILMGVAVVALVGLGAFVGTGWRPNRRRAENVVWSPRTPLAHRQITFSGKARQTALSPDGSYLAYSERGSDSLFLRPTSEGEKVLLTDEGCCPRWTADGTQILFYRYAEDPGARGIYSVPRAGGSARWVAPGGPPFAISPDGKRLVRLQYYDPISRWDSVPQGPYGPVPTVLVIGQLDDPHHFDTLAIPKLSSVDHVQWSLGGKEILIAGEVDATGPSRAFGVTRPFAEIRDPDGTLLGTVPVRDRMDDLWWLPNSHEVLYTLRADENKTLRVASLEQDEGESEIVIPFSGIPLRGFSLSSDGQRLSYVRSLETSRIVVAEILDDGLLRDPRPVTPRTAGVPYLSFSPGEDRVAFTMGPWDGQDLYVSNLDGGEAERLTYLRGSLEPPRWSGDGSTLALAVVDSAYATSLVTVPVDGGPTTTIAVPLEYATREESPEGFWVSWTGDSILHFDFFDEVEDQSLFPPGLVWSDGRQESKTPWRGEDDTLWGTIGPTRQEWVLVAPEGFTVISLEDGSTISQTLIDQALPGDGPAWPVVWTADGWIYFGVSFFEVDPRGQDLEIWRVPVSGGVPAPAVFDPDGTPKRFPYFNTYLSPQANYIGWLESEVGWDVLIAEVSPGG